MEKELKEKRKTAKKKLTDFVPEADREKFAAALDAFVSLQKQMDIEPVELIVPVKEVVGAVDFGAYKLTKTVRGYLFTVKGGLSTFVDMRLTAVYEMLDNLYRAAKGERIGEDKEFDEQFYSAVGYVMQAPIFASLSPLAVFGIAANILATFNDFCDGKIKDAELIEETEDVIRANIKGENFNRAASNILSADIPDVED